MTMRYVQNNVVRMCRNHQRCSPLHDVAGFAQLNFLHETMAVQAAEDIVRKPTSVRVEVRRNRRQPQLVNAP